MSEEDRIESILAADCGSARTKVVLIDLVEDQYRPSSGSEYRFVARAEAPTSGGPPWSDVTVGLRKAISHIEEITGRALLDQEGQLITPEQANGQGVDAFVATSSAAPPLRLLIMGLVDDLSLASARRAVASTYAVIEEVVSLNRVGKNTEDTIDLIRRLQPEAILIVGGTDGGATTPVIDLAKIVASACSFLEEDAQPQILFAGNAELFLQIEKTLGREARLRVVGNVRPALDVENLSPTEAGVERLYQDKLSSLPGFDKLKAWSQAPILPTAKALGYVIRYLARWRDSENSILGVDIGSSAITVAASFDEDFAMRVCSDLGAPPLSPPLGGMKGGDSLGHVLDQIDIEDILGWLPFGMEADRARDIILGKEQQLMTAHQAYVESLLNQAVTREALRLSLARARISWPQTDALVAFKTILASGGVLSHAPHPSQAALILLDALQPIGVSTLLLDTNQLLAPLGALATIHPLAAAQVLDSGGLTTLGTVIVPVGKAQKDKAVLKVKIKFEGGEEWETEAPYGSLNVLPIPLGEMAILGLKPARGFDVGWGRGKKSPPIKVSGGTIGLIVDARGRPLVLPETKDERQARIQQWHRDMGV
jgi:hypothetical protein